MDGGGWAQLGSVSGRCKLSQPGAQGPSRRRRMRMGRLVLRLLAKREIAKVVSKDGRQ